ncbi:MAG: ankyrin repeat domain-containing protein, partial [Desulfomonilaceae bacterium]
SVQLVESFYRHRKQGKGKLEALRLARKEIRDSGFDHPFFWAPFILVGEVGSDPVYSDAPPETKASPTSTGASPEKKVASKTSQPVEKKPESTQTMMSPVLRDLAKDKDLLKAAQSGDVSKVQKLLAEGADIATTDAEYRATPLHWASYKGHKKVVALLLGRGANVNATNKDGRTPLIMTAVAGHRDVVELLLRHKADKDVKDKDGKAAFDWAKDKNHDRIVRLLKR